MDYAAIGAKERGQFLKWRIKAAEARLQDPRLFRLIHDVDACTAVEELSDEDLGKLCTLATAERLKELGYRGAKSNSGDTITPFFTVLLYRIKDEFGREDIELCKGSWEWGHFRGIVNRMEVTNFYRQEMINLIRRVLK